MVFPGPPRGVGLMSVSWPCTSSSRMSRVATPCSPQDTTKPARPGTNGILLIASVSDVTENGSVLKTSSTDMSHTLRAAARSSRNLLPGLEHHSDVDFSPALHDPSGDFELRRGEFLANELGAMFGHELVDRGAPFRVRQPRGRRYAFEARSQQALEILAPQQELEESDRDVRRDDLARRHEVRHTGLRCIELLRARVAEPLDRFVDGHRRILDLRDFGIDLVEPMADFV